MARDFRSGSSVAFDQNWRAREETFYNHWCRGPARNQIQLAFANHFQLFGRFLRRDRRWGGKCLEVGAGRGSISSFFADAGYECTLLDSSAAALTAAEHIFTKNGHSASYVVGDANTLEFSDNTFDVVVSIGLLEHFEDILTPLKEQYRVLCPGGRCFCYVVPENSENIQKHFRWVNAALSAVERRKPAPATASKQPVFRTSSDSRGYLQALSAIGADEIETTGVYPLPMISPSPDFPFTLMRPWAERALTRLFRGVLRLRALVTTKHPWTCDEQLGQAFLVTFRKPANGPSPVA